MTSLKRLFMLDPQVLFLNHGSFGACPRPVFKAYQAWQRRLENQPVQFFQHDLGGLRKEAIGALGGYLHVDPDDLAFVTNVTHGVNVISRSLTLKPGDEILTTDQEYGSCDNAWEFACKKTGALYIHRPVHLPVHSMEEVAEEIWQGVTPRTRVIYLSHITSPTALRLPVEEISRRARQRGILTVIDGAHAPGQIPLDLEALGADFYTGNCHKWMLCPKGTGFIHARREVQHLLQPMVVSRAFEPEKAGPDSRPMVDYFSWAGTSDPAGFLAIPAAIAFMEKYHWPEIQQQCHVLLRQAILRICDLSGLAPLYPLNSGFYAQMGIAPLPPVSDYAALFKRFYHEFHVVMPVIRFHDQLFARISIQAYNTQADVDKLLEILQILQREFAVSL
jgi:isopenicillin-N epimerase